MLRRNAAFTHAHRDVDTDRTIPSTTMRAISRVDRRRASVIIAFFYDGASRTKATIKKR
jgi:hypothetical protein